MTDHGERKVREWALKRNGDPLEPHDVVELVFALDQDNEDRHKESMVAFADLEKKVDEHLEWTNTVSIPRLAAVEGAVEDISCIRGEHTALHENHLTLEHTHAPRRVDDPKTSTFDDQREDEAMKVSFRFGKWFAAALIVVMLGVGANYVMLRRSTASDTQITKQDFHQLVQLLEAEHGTPAPTPAP